LLMWLPERRVHVSLICEKCVTSLWRCKVAGIFQMMRFVVIVTIQFDRVGARM
jgi:hypothetical protein